MESAPSISGHNFQGIQAHDHAKVHCGDVHNYGNTYQWVLATCKPRDEPTNSWSEYYSRGHDDAWLNSDASSDIQMVSAHSETGYAHPKFTPELLKETHILPVSVYTH